MLRHSSRERIECDALAVRVRLDSTLDARTLDRAPTIDQCCPRLVLRSGLVNEASLAVRVDCATYVAATHGFSRLALPYLALPTRLLQIDASIAAGALHELKGVTVRNRLTCAKYVAVLESDAPQARRLFVKPQR